MSRRPDPEPIWLRPEPGQRRPGYTRDEIARTALLIADEEGPDALSMRRIARVLGAGTMTLYHYVQSKDELMQLVGDAIMSELVIPDDELPDGWRDALAAIARRTYEVTRRHAWIIDHFREDRGHGGPNALRHIEQSLAVAARTGLPMLERAELTGLVDDYVFGHVIRQREASSTTDPADDWIGEFRAHIDALAGDDAFPALREMFDVDPAEFKRFADDPLRFERGLQTLLDGVEAQLKRRGTS
jgi:AcrR family transcriptional regulator